MDLRRLRVGEWVVGISGLVLLVSLFLPWYAIDEPVVFGPIETFTESASGWEAFAILDVLLALGAMAAIAVMVVTAAQSTPALPLALQSLLTLVAIVLLVLVLFRVVNPPTVTFVEQAGPGVVRAEAENPDRGVGAALGLMGVLAMVLGSLVAIRDERRSPDGAHTDLTGVPAASPPEIETLPAPRPEAGR
jgi:hypothetical protein